MKYFVGILSILLVLSSCRTLKTNSSPVIHEVKETAYLSKAAIEHDKVAFSQKTLEAKIDATYDDGENVQDLSIKLKLEKDKVIWMSGNFLGIPMAKIMITPARIQFYEKINKTYFDGDFSLFQHFFGVEMSFNQIQNLLLGQAFFSFTDGVAESKNEVNQIILTPLIQDSKFDIFYLIDPANYKLIRQEAILSNDKSLKVVYTNYEKVSDELIPAKIKIESLQQTQKIKIILDIRNVELNNQLSFPFDIPGGYEKLDFEKIKAN